MRTEHGRDEHARQASEAVPTDPRNRHGSASLDASQQVTPLNEESDEEPVRIVIDDVSADD
jgi:hypothetical protein